MCFSFTDETGESKQKTNTSYFPHLVSPPANEPERRDGKISVVSRDDKALQGFTDPVLFPQLPQFRSRGEIPTANVHKIQLADYD